jgi:hypothetical protein
MLNSKLRINHWKELTYHDPGEILRRLRFLEVELAGIEMDDRLRRWRTTGLRKYLEWRDAAIFAYGMGAGKVAPMEYATEEAEDYDFVVRWVEGETLNYCPVQLKELVPEDLNPTTSLRELIDGLSKYGTESDTVLAIKLNRQDNVELLTQPDIRFKQLWFFGATAPASSRFCLYGDALGGPEYFPFDYPASPPKNFLGPDGQPLPQHLWPSGEG